MKTSHLKSPSGEELSLADRVFCILETAIKSSNGFISTSTGQDSINEVGREFVSGLQDSRHPFDIAYDQLLMLVHENRLIELTSKSDPVNDLAQSFSRHKSPDLGGTHDLQEVLSQVDELMICVFPVSLDKSCFGDPVTAYAQEHFARSTPSFSKPTQTKESFYQAVKQLLGPNTSPLMEVSPGETKGDTSSHPLASVKSKDTSDVKAAEKHSQSATMVRPVSGESQASIESNGNKDLNKAKSENAGTKSLLDRVRDLTKRIPGRLGSLKVLRAILGDNSRIWRHEVLEATMEELKQLRKTAQKDENFFPISALKNMDNIIEGSQEIKK